MARPADSHGRGGELSFLMPSSNRYFLPVAQPTRNACKSASCENPRRSRYRLMLRRWPLPISWLAFAIAFGRTALARS